MNKKETAQISSIITQPEFAAKFDSGVVSIAREIDTMDLDKWETSFESINVKLLSENFWDIDLHLIVTLSPDLLLLPYLELGDFYF